MSQTGPWSVKGIDARAREAARERARQEGMTLGEYLNSLILKGGEVGAQDIVAPIAQPKPRSQAGASSLNKLVSRIEAAEARSTLAITGIDQSVVGLLKRIEDTETEHIAMARHVDGVIDDIRSTYDALRDKVRRIEEDDSAEQNLEALKALEGALGKLASHVYEENALAQNESEAIKGRVESGFSDISERLESMDTKVEQTLADAARRVEKAVEQAELRAEGTTRHLSERMSLLDSKIGRQERVEEEIEGRAQETETRIGTAEAAIDETGARVDAIESDVTTALESMEGTLLRVQDRVNRAETTTEAALKSLESTFDVLDQRIGEVAQAAPEQANEIRKEFEQRFEGLADDLRASIAATRTELANEIEKAAKAGITPEQVDLFDAKLSDVQRRLSDNDERHGRAIETVGDQVNRISENFDKRIQVVEADGGSAKVAEVREEVSKLTGAVQDRLEAMEKREATALERVGDEMTKIADQLDQRISDSEQRSASAIEQVGEQVSRVATRLQTRQDEALQAFSEKLDSSKSRSEARLSDALANVSERLDLMQRQTASTLSPVQKAIASLATRLDSLEEFASPPFADAPREAALPEMRPLPINDPLFADLEKSDDDSATQPETLGASEPASPPETDADFSGTASTIIVDIDDAPQAAETEDGFEPGIESWDDMRDEAVAQAKAETPQESEFTAEVPHPEAADLNDPISELENWDDAASETRDIDIFDDVFESPDEIDPKAAARASKDSGLDYINNARAAARSAAAESTAGSTRRDKSKENEKSVRKPKAGRAASTNTSSGEGGSKLPLIATASVVALAAAGGTAYYAMKGNEKITLQQIETPQLPAAAPAPAQIASNAPANESSSLAGANEIAAPVETRPHATTGVSQLQDAVAPSAAGVTRANTPSPAENVQQRSQGTQQPAPAPTAKTVAPEAAVLSRPPAPRPQPMIAQIDVPRTIEAAANSGDPRARYALAVRKLDSGDYSEGAKLMRQAAESGEPAAQYRYGKLHEKGLGVPRDLTLARKWTEDAANGGNIRAMHDLAVFYAQGDGGPQSYAVAVNWFRKAAEFGVVDSQYNLGVLYERGIGIDPDPSEALFWFIIAARGGDGVSAEKIDPLSKALPVATSTGTTSRAQGWTAKKASGHANGFFPNVNWGSVTSKHIAQVQTALNGLGYNAGQADGAIGPSTTKAIRSFEQEYGLAASGKVTPALIRKINQVTQRGS